MCRFLTSLFNPSCKSSGKMTGPCNPAEWSIVEESPSGLELTFSNHKTGYATFYTPEGMTAKEILEIPGAQKYWKSKEAVEQYMREKAAEKLENGGEDYNTQH